MTTQKTTQSIDSKENLNPSSISLQAWVAWAVVSFFYAFQYILRVSPSIFIDDIRIKFALDTQQFGDFSGIYYIGYAAAHIPVGLLLDHLSPRLVISASILLCTLGIAPLVFTDSWELAFWGRFLLGAGSSTAILGVFKVIRLTFPAKKMGTILGFSVTIGLIGAVYGGRPVQSLVAFYGWQSIMTMMIIAGAVLAVLTYLLIPKRTNQEDASSTNSIFTDIAIVSKTPFVLSTALLAAFMVGPLEGFADVWGASFLEQVSGFSKSVAAFSPSLLYIGMGIGSPLLAYIGEKTNAHKRIVRFSALIMGLSFTLLLTTPLSQLQTQALLFVMGIFCAYQVLVMYINGMRVAAKYSGLVTAITNMVIMSFGYVFNHYVGGLMNDLWAGEALDGIRVYPPEAYTHGLMIIPVGLFAAFIGFYGELIYKKFILKD